MAPGTLMKGFKRMLSGGKLDKKSLSGTVWLSQCKKHLCFCPVLGRCYLFSCKPDNPVLINGNGSSSMSTLDKVLF